MCGELAPQVVRSKFRKYSVPVNNGPDMLLPIQYHLVGWVGGTAANGDWRDLKQFLSAATCATRPQVVSDLLLHCLVSYSRSKKASNVGPIGSATSHSIPTNGMLTTGHCDDRVSKP